MSINYKHLVLDAQGVTFNAPLESFFKKISIQLDFEENEISLRWYKKYRKMAWLGQIEDSELICGLTDEKISTCEFLNQLENEFVMGPIAVEIRSWASILPVWILSNHRSEWLYKRLERFELAPYIERVFVSEETGYLKPQPEAFTQMTREGLVPDKTVFLDDQIKNINRALEYKMRAFLVKDSDVIQNVNDILFQTEKRKNISQA